MGAGRYSGERPWRRTRRVITGAAPAAGADWIVTVPSGKLWRLVGLTASLVTAVAAANRSPRLVVTDGKTTTLILPPVAVQAASLTGAFTWAAHVDSYATAPDQVIALPDLTLQAGWTIAVSTTAIQAADQWSIQALLVIETTVKGGDVDFGELPDMMVELVGTPAT